MNNCPLKLAWTNPNNQVTTIAVPPVIAGFPLTVPPNDQITASLPDNANQCYHFIYSCEEDECAGLFDCAILEPTNQVKSYVQSVAGAN